MGFMPGPADMQHLQYNAAKRALCCCCDWWWCCHVTLFRDAEASSGWHQFLLTADVRVSAPSCAKCCSPGLGQLPVRSAACCAAVWLPLMLLSLWGSMLTRHVTGGHPWQPSHEPERAGGSRPERLQRTAFPSLSHPELSFRHLQGTCSHP